MASTGQQFTEHTEKHDPSKFISDILGSPVKVKLHSGVEYLGNMQTIDGYMNIVLENAEEVVESTSSKRSFGDVFIRGNNGMYTNMNRVSQTEF